MAEAKTVFHYFPTFGRGEPIRLALHYFDIPYSDHLQTPESWFQNGEKENYEFKQVPMLEIDGKKLVQSMAILRYICQKKNSHPTDPAEAALVEAIVDLRYEIYEGAAVLNYTQRYDEAKEWHRQNVKRYLNIIEQLLANNSTGQGKHFVGSCATMADFVMFEFGYNIFLRPKNHDLESEFRPIAPKFFTFLDSFRVSKASFKNFMDARDDETEQFPF